jgi:hypothetical protein
MTYSLSQRTADHLEGTMKTTTKAAMVAAALGLIAMEASAQTATGCVNRGGQLSRLQIGEEPVGGQCGPNQEVVRFQLEGGEQEASRLAINAEAPINTEVDLGELGEFVFTARCSPLSGGRVLIRFDAVNNTDGLLLIYERDGTLHDIASGFPLVLWAPEIIPPEVPATRSGEGALPIATQEGRNVYDFELAAAVLDGSTCRFVGEVALFTLEEEPS